MTSSGQVASRPKTASTNHGETNTTVNTTTATTTTSSYRRSFAFPPHRTHHTRCRHHRRTPRATAHRRYRYQTADQAHHTGIGLTTSNTCYPRRGWTLSIRIPTAGRIATILIASGRSSVLLLVPFTPAALWARPCRLNQVWGGYEGLDQVCRDHHARTRT